MASANNRLDGYFLRRPKILMSIDDMSGTSLF